ncbi:MAG: oligosaccharide flippase family protein [bacterium]|nr:oligosaccharide flippase family protein [bacterium]
MIFLSLLIICGFNGWPIIGQSFLNAILRTEYTALTQISSSLIRLTVSLLLIYLGYGFVGLMMGYVVAGLTTSILMLAFPINILKKLGARFSISLESIKDSVEAGIVTWIPNLLTLIGQWVGVLGLFSMIGVVETGLYFVAFTMTSVIMSIPQSILILSFPSISGMGNGRKKAMSRTVKISTSLMAPIAFFLILYPSTIPEFLGRTYVGASDLIRILSLGYLVSPINAGYIYYAYAIGNYRDVLIAGLAGTIPRLLLYPFMISLHEDVGAAITFSMGNITTLLMVVICAQRKNYGLQFKQYLKIIIIPIGISTMLMFFKIDWIIGLVSLSTSYIIYGRLRIITKEDLREIGESLISKEILEKLYPYLRPLLLIIYGS